MTYKSAIFLSCMLTSMTIHAETDNQTDEKVPSNQIGQNIAAGDVHRGDDMIITTGHKLFPNTTVATPSFNVSKEDIAKTNLTSAEDAIRMAPSVHVRRRFYGDTNGVTAIRGSTNFQTGHFNMFVDGIPLHNPVQTKWNGAPKWNLIAPNAIESTTVFYGPYSAEHKGAFGGTFDLKTSLPQKFEMSVDVSGFIQQSHRAGQKEEILTGHKEFISAGNRFGDFMIYGFFNHLENEGQPQSFTTSTANPAGTNGAFPTRDIDGNQRFLTGDSGIAENIIDLYELKIGYDFNEDLRALFTIALEDTEKTAHYRTYTKDNATGTNVWQSRQRGTENERKTLAYALNLSGKVTEDWDIDTTVSYFDAFKDETRQSDHSRNDPAFFNDADGKEGTITDNEIWWVDYSLKLATQNFMGRDDIGFMAGYQYNYSYLDINRYDTNPGANVFSSGRGDLTQANGGSTQTNSGFVQLDWDFIDNWNVMAGLRYDYWNTFRGHSRGNPFDDRDASRLSPKASLSFTPTDNLSFRYSFSKAYRFPLAEELFDSSSNTNFINNADPTLSPESGYFHDFKIQYELDQGFTSISLFYNTIEDEILRTTTLLVDPDPLALPGSTITSNRTRGIDKTETIGVEFIYQQDYIFDLPFGITANGTWINKEVKKDSNNPATEGNEWVRIPKWRANATLTYHTTEQWDNHIAVQYRSRQFTREDNSDQKYHVFGATDDYVLVNFKSSYKMDVGNDITAKFSVGVDNILDEDYYDHHPYPQRTYFANIGLDI